MERRVVILILMLVFFSSLVFAQSQFSSPRAVFEYYKESLGKEDAKAADSCYTEESLKVCGPNRMFKKSYQVLSGRSYAIEQYTNRAIVRWTKYDSKLGNFYLKKENGLWKIDCAFMARNIIYDQNNNWYWRNKDSSLEQRWIRGELD